MHALECEPCVDVALSGPVDKKVLERTLMPLLRHCLICPTAINVLRNKSRKSVRLGGKRKELSKIQSLTVKRIDLRSSKSFHTRKGQLRDPIRTQSLTTRPAGDPSGILLAL